MLIILLRKGVIKMADIEKILRKIERIGNMGTKERAKFFERLLKNGDFMKFLFDPFTNEKDPAQKKILSDQVQEMYNMFSLQESIEAFNKMLKNQGESSSNDFYEYSFYPKETRTMGRSQATFLNSIANIALEEMNSTLRDATKKKTKGDITSAEARDIADDMDEYKSEIQKLLKRIKKLIREDVKSIYKKTGMPEEIIRIALVNVPDPKYVNRYKLVFYMNNVLNLIYETAYHMEGNECRNINAKTWVRFFKEIFGEDNVVECATFILLEGVNRYDKYRDSQNVKKIWDSLTDFALSSLDAAPEKLRTQMMDLYTKRIEKMFKNNSYDLRVDLRSLSKIDYPHLFETASKYIGIISNIINKVSK